MLIDSLKVSFNIFVRSEVWVFAGIYTLVNILGLFLISKTPEENFLIFFISTFVMDFIDSLMITVFIFLFLPVIFGDPNINSLNNISSVLDIVFKLAFFAGIISFGVQMIPFVGNFINSTVIAPVMLKGIIIIRLLLSWMMEQLDFRYLMPSIWITILIFFIVVIIGTIITYAITGIIILIIKDESKSELITIACMGVASIVISIYGISSYTIYFLLKSLEFVS